MGGAFIDCNQLFCQLSNYTKQEVCSLTIFNLTARQDLQHAFDLISQMISPPLDAQEQKRQPLVLRGAMNNRNDLGLGVSLVKGSDGIAKFFCVTLIRNPASPFDESQPIPATADLVHGNLTFTRQQSQQSSRPPAAIVAATSSGATGGPVAAEGSNPIMSIVVPVTAASSGVVAIAASVTKGGHGTNSIVQAGSSSSPTSGGAPTGGLDSAPAFTTG